MCGILGFATGRPGDPAVWSIFEAAFRLSEGRGRDASGVAGHAGAAVLVHKRAVPASKLLRDEGYRAVRVVEPEVVIAHTRLATKGSPADSANNHPVCAGPVVGVHNGMLRNDDALFRVLGLRRDGEVDSEAIFRLVEFFCPERVTAAGLWKALDLVEGSYAVAVVHARQPGELWLARGTRPLAVAWDGGAGDVLVRQRGAVPRRGVRGGSGGRWRPGRVGSPPGHGAARQVAAAAGRKGAGEVPRARARGLLRLAGGLGVGRRSPPGGAARLGGIGAGVAVMAPIRSPGYGKPDAADYAEWLDMAGIPRGPKPRGREWDGVEAVEGAPADCDVEAEALAAVGEPPAVARARRILAPLVAGAAGRPARDLLPDAAALLCEKAPKAAERLTTRALEGLLEEMLLGES
jgi:predicted glutamine amidotransferase